MPDAPLIVRGLTAGYGGVPILRDVSIEAPSGALTVVVGLNGAGKSTLLKAIAGVAESSAGEIELNGVDVRGKPPERLLRMGLSYVPQVANIFPSLTVHENLEMGAYSLRSGVPERIAEAFDLFPDLRSASRRAARTLSGGQRNMLAVARGLMVRPTVLLLDEPTAGLAPKAEADVWDRILAIRETGVALLVVDQNVRRALSQADWGFVLSMGRNLSGGPAGDLLKSGDVGDLYRATS